VTQTIDSITNPSGTTIRINTTNLGTLGNGDLVTIGGVTGDPAINGRWIVENVTPTSFDLKGAIYNGPYSGGTWTWDPSFVTFLKPPGYTPPTDNATHQFTFSTFLGTTVPANITSSVSQAPSGTVITINGTGFTGVYGVSFNGYAGTLVGGAIASIDNSSSPITINTANTTGLADGDTVTISGVTDPTTHTPAAINRQWVVTNVVPNHSFQLMGSTANGDPLSGGNWIDGTDSAVKVIVPSATPNTGNTTYPGPTGKIGVRNASGTNYSSVDFTIGESAATRVAFVQQPTGGLAGAVITPPVTVQVEDASGNPVSGTFTVTLALGANPGGGVLGGTLTQTTDGSGLATFSDLTISRPGLGYTLVASASAMTPVTSAAFDETDTDTLTPRADLALTQSGTPNPVAAGTNLTYRLTVTNSGPSDAQGAVLTDALPSGTVFQSVAVSQGTASAAGGTVTADLGTLPVGGTATVTVVVRIPPGTPGRLPLTNAASVVSSTPDPNPTNNSAAVTDTVVAPTPVGVFDPTSATWYLKNTNQPGAPDVPPFRYGAPSWTPLTGDWDGNGTRTAGAFDPITATWYLRNDNSAGAPDFTPFQYGMPGWIPVVGDWDGNGTTTIGVVDPVTMTWYLKNSNGPGAWDVGFRFGQAGDIPVVGDWDGNGVTTIGVWRPGTATWFLRNENSAGAPDFTPFAYGQAGDVPVAGDWNADRVTTVGVFRPATATWYLRNSNTPGAPDIGPFAYGGANWLPVTSAYGWAGLLRAGDGAPTADPQPPLTQAALDGIVGAALSRLQDAGVGGALLGRLAAAQFQVSDLPATELGVALPSTDRVLIDRDAAGHGWFVDPTPLQDEEYAPAPWGALAAPAGTPAGDHMDLLTVVLHELGNLAGLTDVSAAANPADLMGDLLGRGNRLTTALDRVFAHSPF
jgi:uncharacterized repeat protein (TIGR01451 family)